jgi:hypothetical protein
MSDFAHSLIGTLQMGSGLTLVPAQSLGPGDVQLLTAPGDHTAAVNRAGAAVLSATNRLVRWGRLRVRCDAVPPNYSSILDVNPLEKLPESAGGSVATVFLTADGFFSIGTDSHGPVEITAVLDLRKAVVTVIPFEHAGTAELEWSVRGPELCVTCGVDGGESWADWLRDVIRTTQACATAAGSLPPTVTTQELLRGGALQHRIVKGTLFWAGETGNGEAATRLVTPAVSRLDPVFGCSVSSKDDVGNTPLHYAAAAGKVAVVSVLLAHSASVNAANSDGKTPLHYACLRGDAATVAALLRSDVPFVADSVDRDGNTVVHSAVASAAVTTIVDVLRALPPALVAAARTVSNHDGLTPLHTLALRSTRLAAGNTDETQLAAACAVLFEANPAGDTLTLSPVANVRCKVAGVTCTPLLMACGSPHGVVVSTDASGPTSHVTFCSPIVINELLKHGASPNCGVVERKLTPLHVLLNEIRACLLTVEAGTQALSEVEGVLERLVRAALIVVHHGGRWDVADSNGTTARGLCQAAVRLARRVVKGVRSGNGSPRSQPSVATAASSVSPASSTASGVMKELVALETSLETAVKVYGDLPGMTNEGPSLSSMPEDLWMADGDSGSCPQCHSEFTLSHRRHHCRLCGGLTCAQCSSKVLAMTLSPTVKRRASFVGKAAAADRGDVPSAQRSCDGCYNRFRYVLAHGQRMETVPEIAPADSRSGESVGPITVSVNCARGLVIPAGVAGPVTVFGRIGDAVSTSEPSTNSDVTEPLWSRGRLHFPAAAVGGNLEIAVLVGPYAVGTLTIPVQSLLASPQHHTAYTWKALTRGGTGVGDVFLRVDVDNDLGDAVVCATPPVTVVVNSGELGSLPEGAAPNDIDAYSVVCMGLNVFASSSMRCDASLVLRPSRWKTTVGLGPMPPAYAAALSAATVARVEVWDRRVSQPDRFLGSCEVPLDRVKALGATHCDDFELWREGTVVGKLNVTLSTQPDAAVPVVLGTPMKPRGPITVDQDPHASAFSRELAIAEQALNSSSLATTDSGDIKLVVADIVEEETKTSSDHAAPTSVKGKAQGDAHSGVQVEGPAPLEVVSWSLPAAGEGETKTEDPVPPPAPTAVPAPSEPDQKGKSKSACCSVL